MPTLGSPESSSPVTDPHLQRLADARWLERLVAPLADPTVAGVYGRQIPPAGSDPVEAYFLRRTYDGTPRVKRLGADGRLETGVSRVTGIHFEVDYSVKGY